MKNFKVVPPVFGFIYLIKNSINGKIYVGQSTSSVSRRWSQHKHLANRLGGWHLQAALRKWKPENFEIQAVAVACTQKQLDNLEQNYILLLGSRNPSVGYNVRLPLDDRSFDVVEGGRKSRSGEKNKNFKSHVKTEILIEQYQKGASLCELGRIYDLSRYSISKRLKKAGIEINPQPHKKNLPEKEICEKYLSGIPTHKLCRLYDVSTHPIADILKRNRIEIRNRSIDITLDEIKKEYDRCLNCSEVSKKLGIDSSYVRRLLKDSGVKIKTREDNLIFLPVEQIVKEYKSGQSTTDLARKYSVSKSTIRLRLIENQVDLRKISGSYVRNQYTHTTA